MGPQIFGMPKSKKEKKAKKERVSKQKLLKDVTKKVKIYCFSHSRASRTQKFFLLPNHSGRQYFSVFLGPSTLKSISPALFLEKSVILLGNRPTRRVCLKVNIYSITCSFTERFPFVNIHSRTCNIHSLTGVNSLFM